MPFSYIALFEPSKIKIIRVFRLGVRAKFQEFNFQNVPVNELGGRLNHQIGVTSRTFPVQPSNMPEQLKKRSPG